MVHNTSAPVDFSTIATQTVVAAIPGKRIVVFGYTLTNGVATAQTVQFRSGATTALTGVMSLPSAVGGGLVNNASSDRNALFMTAPGEALSLVITAATQVA